MNKYENVSDNVKEMAKSHPQLMLNEILRHEYSEISGRDVCNEKQLIKMMVKKFRLDKQYDRFTDKQLKEIIKKQLKVINNRKKQEIDDIIYKFKNSKQHIVDIDLEMF